MQREMIDDKQELAELRSKQAYLQAQVIQQRKEIELLEDKNELLATQKYQCDNEEEPESLQNKLEQTTLIALQ